jgi:hypothetical protein
LKQKQDYKMQQSHDNKRWMRRRFRTNNSNGSQLAEFGPALFLLLIVGLLPALDLIFMGIAFSTAWYLNQAEAREAANNMPPSNGGKPPRSYYKSQGDLATYFPPVQVLENAFLNSGLEKFIGANETECCLTQSNTDGSFGGWGVTLVEVTSTVEVRPLAGGILKNFVTIPGINAPAVFKFYTRARQEDQGEF